MHGLQQVDANLVTEAELLPLLVSRKLWFDRLANVRSINFVDNDAAKHSCIRGTSDSPTCAEILKAMFMLEAQLQTWSWFTRVCSASNCADPPSRLEISRTVREFNAKVWTAPQPLSLRGGQWVDG